MKKIIVPIVVILIITIVIIVYMINDRSADDGRLVLSGAIEAEEIELAFKAPGRVVYVSIDEGDDIAEGDTVAELSHEESAARIRQVESQINAAEANLEMLEIGRETIARNLAKITELVASGGATAGDQEDLSDRLREADAAILAAESSIGSLESQRDFLRIVHDEEFLISPSAGTVLLKSVEPGEVVSQGRTVLTIADLDNLEIKVYLPESKLGLVKNGQDVAIEIDSNPGESFKGIIRRISNKAEFTPKNVQTREERVKTVYAVVVGAQSQGGILKPGMPCDVIIDLVR